MTQKCRFTQPFWQDNSIPVYKMLLRKGILTYLVFLTTIIAYRRSALYRSIS